MSDDPGRRVAHTEQPALALGDDLEPNGALVEPRMELLELAERSPLRLADGLAGRLDLAEVLHHRLAFRFFRLHAARRRRRRGRLGLRRLRGRRRCSPAPTSAVCRTIASAAASPSASAAA